MLIMTLFLKVDELEDVFNEKILNFNLLFYSNLITIYVKYMLINNKIRSTFDLDSIIQLLI